MNVAILDDYQDTIRSLPCLAKMTGHHVTITTIFDQILAYEAGSPINVVNPESLAARA